MTVVAHVLWIARKGVLAIFAAVVVMLSVAGQSAAVESVDSPRSGNSTARVGVPSPAEFVAQAREAGLSGEKAAALQAKVDDYLVKLQGQGTQISPNRIDMDGAELIVTVPGEMRPRQLDHATGTVPRPGCMNLSETWTPAEYGWFCAFRYENGIGDIVAMYHCGNYHIPWFSTGSWWNNQTTGTRPTLYFVVGSGQPPWRMPASFSAQYHGVDWSPVNTITNC
jgi:hypothetical protein